jgi:cell wall-associated NlpC family hydrolase
VPDVGMADYQMGRQRRIIMACEKQWPLMGPNNLINSADCSGFVQSVAKELGIALGGNANAMYTAIQSPPWSRLGVGDHAAHLAAVAATNGKFVIGAWKNPSGGNGHVAVTVPHRTRAIAYWGTLGSEGEKYAKHSESWNSTRRAQVLYSARDF